MPRQSFDAAMPIHMHVSEQQGEVAECIATHGTTPLAWIADLVALDGRWTLIHATHLTALEMRQAAKAGACVGLCPVTEANLGDGIFDFVPWFEMQGAWGIGGDSHVCVSPLRGAARARIQPAAAHARAQRDRRRGTSRRGRESLERRGGRRCAGHRATRSARIEPGKRADLVVLDGDDADFEGLGAAARLGVAMFSGEANRVRDVLVAGRPVVEQGRHPDEEEARAAFRGALRRLRSAP